MKTRVFAVCVVVFLFCGITHAGLSDGLVAYYPFNGNANDESGNGNNGVVHGATLITDRLGNPNSAYYFNGIDNYIDIARNQQFSQEGKDKITVSVWINILKPAAAIICGRPFWMIHWDASVLPDKTKMAFYVFDGSFYGKLVVSNSAVSEGWHQWVGVYDGTKISIYLDGKIENSLPHTGPITNGHNGDDPWFVIGKDYHPSTGVEPGRWNKGSVDELRIYNRALSEAEIQQLYNEGQVCPDVAVKPYTFTSGTSAKAAEVNADFNTLYQQINTQNCQIQALKAIVCQDHPTASVCK